VPIKNSFFAISICTRRQTQEFFVSEAVKAGGFHILTIPAQVAHCPAG
jgi:hypothetical protein